MIKLKYSDLTDEQKEIICNGCGGKSGWLNPPEFLFSASCNQHDFYYWRGGTEDDRLEADNAFYEAMLSDIQNYVVWYKRWSYKLIAYAYYKSVRLFGKKFFQYGTMKTKTDIDAYIIRAMWISLALEVDIEIERIQAIKQKAAELINLKYPDYKQLNIIRVGAELEAMSAYIDSIREKSNKAEQDGIKMEDVQWQ